MHITGRRPGLYAPLTRNDEACPWFDEQGLPMAMAEEKRAAWQETLRRMHGEK